MPSNVEEIWKNAVNLSIAWEELADHGMPGFNYREKLRKLRNFDEDRTVEESERRFYLLEDKEWKLKIQMLRRIEYGDFDAYGRNITNSIDAGISKLPNSLFDQMAKGFEVEWDANRLFVREMKFIDIRIAPTNVARPEFAKPNVSPKRTGRPNIDDKVRPVIEKLMKERTDFSQLTRAKQCDLVRETIVGPNVDHINPPKGFTDSAIKARLRDMLPS